MNKYCPSLKQSLNYVLLIGSLCTGLIASSVLADEITFVTDQARISPLSGQNTFYLDNGTTLFSSPAGLFNFESSRVSEQNASTSYRQGQKAMHTLVEKSDLTTVSIPIGELQLNQTTRDRWENAVPSFFTTWRLSDHVALGLGVNTHLGQGMTYPSDWLGRYESVENQFATVNLNPILATRLSDDLSLSIGVNFQAGDAQFSNPLAISFNTRNRGRQQVQGNLSMGTNDWTAGFNAGLYYQPSDTTHIGLTYRSSLTHHLTGEAEFNLPDGSRASANGMFQDTAITSNYVVPDLVSLGLYQEISPQLAVTGEVAWQNWSCYTGGAVDFGNPNQPDIANPQPWHDTIRVGLGLMYDASDTWTFRTGVVYDPSPMPGSTDGYQANDFLVDFSVNYHPNPNLTVMFGYNRTLSINQRLSSVVPGANLLVHGDANNPNLLGLRVWYRF